jgi:hypothetical protein
MIVILVDDNEIIKTFGMKMNNFLREPSQPPPAIPDSLACNGPESTRGQFRYVTM